MLDLFSSASFAETVRHFSIVFIPAFLGIILHEVGHGWAALKMGDPTAKLMGRITLNPLPHIDPMGLLCFVLTSLSGAFVFGWAKPVPVDMRNFRDPRKGMLLCSLAGPGTNVVLAFLFAGALKLFLVLDPGAAYSASPTELFLGSTLAAGVSINLCLAILNMLPVPPLDGSKVLAYFLPARAAFSYLAWQRWGFLVLLVLIVAGLLDKILVPLLQGSYTLVLSLFGI